MEMEIEKEKEKKRQETKNAFLLSSLSEAQNFISILFVFIMN